MHEFDFVRMAPDDGLVAGGLPIGITAKVLAERGTAYAVYLGPTGEYSVRWTDRLEPRQSETCTFHTVSTGGVRLWVDGRKVIDHWAPHPEAEDSGTVALVEGREVDITMEYGKGVGGGGSAKLHWSGPGRQRRPDPGRGDRSGPAGASRRDFDPHTLGPRGERQSAWAGCHAGGSIAPRAVGRADPWPGGGSKICCN